MGVTKGHMWLCMHAKMVILYSPQINYFWLKLMVLRKETNPECFQCFQLYVTDALNILSDLKYWKFLNRTLVFHLFLLEVLTGRVTCLINKMRKWHYYKNVSCSGILPSEIWGSLRMKIAFDSGMIRNHSYSNGSEPFQVPLGIKMCVQFTFEHSLDCVGQLTCRFFNNK